jgi:tetratricopeptide (TPR) repeat protein
MRIQLATLCALVFAAGRPALAEVATTARLGLHLRAKKPVVDKSTPQGQFLELISMEGDALKRQILYEQFLVMFPGPSYADWIYERLLADYEKTASWAKYLSTGEKLVLLQPGNLNLCHSLWKAAEAKQDAVAVRRWKSTTEELARQIVAAPKPADPSLLDEWQERNNFARQFTVDAEYDLYLKAFKETDVRSRLRRLDELIEKYPRTRYLNQVNLLYYLCYKQLGDTDKSVPFAEQVVAADKMQIDPLLHLADHWFRRVYIPSKVLLYCRMILEALEERKLLPSGVSEEQWAESRAQYEGMAHYMTGIVHLNSERFEAADQSLRAAVNYIKGAERLSHLYNSLGYANYRLTRYNEALHFYTLCLGIAGPYQAQAAKNIKAVQAELRQRE